MTPKKKLLPTPGEADYEEFPPDAYPANLPGEPLTRACATCGGQGATAECAHHSSASCPYAADRRCEDCDGTGRSVIDCDAYDRTQAPPGCRDGAEGRCPDCDEALCTRHLAWHRAECQTPEEPRAGVTSEYVRRLRWWPMAMACGHWETRLLHRPEDADPPRAGVRCDRCEPRYTGTGEEPRRTPEQVYDGREEAQTDADVHNVRDGR